MFLVLPGNRNHPEFLRLIRASGFSGVETPKAINHFLQSQWLKAGPGTYRAEIKGRKLLDQEREVFQSLGFIDEIPPICLGENKTPVILGATAKAIYRRVRWFEQQEEYQGLIPFLLGSARPIIENLESRETFPAMIAEVGEGLSPHWDDPHFFGYKEDFWPKDEAEMMEFIFCLTTGSEAVCQTFCAPLNEQGKADTKTTAKAWVESRLKTGENGGNFVLISSQPFCRGQLLAFLEVAPRSWCFSVCGPSAPATLSAEVYYDNAAKQYFAECKALGLI